jgi:cobalt-zinc-cadmium efflux system membrane fusion protein
MRHITPGELVTNEHEVYTIADLSDVWAEIHVFSQDRQFVREGQTVTITADNGNSTRETVSYLSPIIDPDTRTSTALVTINNPTEMWLPGSFAQAEFITDEIEVPLLVQKEAIQNVDGVDVLFISAANGFEVRPITKGLSDENHCEILSGLELGEHYACKNTFLLKADLKKDEAEHMD